MTRRVAESVASPIEQRWAEIAEQRALTLRLQRAEIADRLQHGFLYDVGGVNGVPGPSRDAAVRPAMKRWNVTLKKSIKCPTVTGTGASKQFDRGRIGHRRSCHRGPTIQHPRRASCHEARLGGKAGTS